MTRGRVLGLTASILVLFLASLALGGAARPAGSTGVDLSVTVTVTGGDGRTVLQTPAGASLSDHRLAYSWTATFDFTGVPEQGDFTLEGGGTGTASWTDDSSSTISGDATPACHAAVTNAEGQLGANLNRGAGGLSLEVLGQFADDDCSAHSSSLVYPGLLFRIFRPDAEATPPLRVPLSEGALKGASLTPALPDYNDQYSYVVEEYGEQLVATNTAQVHVTTECRGGAGCGNAITLEDDRIAEPPPEPPRPVGRVLVQASGDGTVTTDQRAAAGDPALPELRCGVGAYSCYAETAPGADVTLRATPARGKRFVGWSGACSGSSPVCAVAASAGGSTSVGAVFAPAAGRTVAATLNVPRLAVRWARSVPHGSLAASGSVGAGATLHLQLRRPGGGALLSRTLHVRRGSFRLRAALPRHLLPGGFVVSLTGRARGRAVPPQVRTVAVPAPPEGVIRRAYASSAHGGAPATRFQHGVQELWATFDLAAQPIASPVTVSWYQGGKLLGTRTKSNRPAIETGIRAAAGLPAARYRVDLSAGGRVVGSLSIAVR